MATLTEPIAVVGTTTPDEWFEGVQPDVGPAEAGTLTLTVADAVDFDEDGGTLRIGAEVIDYTGIDDELGTIHLAAPLGSTYPPETRVDLEPPAYEKFAQVMVGDHSEAVEVEVPHALWDKLLDGIREGGKGEVVTLTLHDDTFTLAQVHGMEPEVDGGYLLDETAPPEAWMDGSLYATVGFVDGGFVAGDLFGANTMMSAAGFTADNADGDRTFQVDALTGNVSIVGLYASALVPNEPHVVIGDLAGEGTTRSFMYFYTGEELDAAGVPVTGYAPGEVSSGVDTDGTRYIRLISPDTPGVVQGQLSIKSSVDTTTRPTLAWSGDIRLRGDAGIVYALNASNTRAPLTIQGSALVLDVPNGTMRLGEATTTGANRLRSRDSADTARRTLELEAENILLDFSGGALRVRDAGMLPTSYGQITAPDGDVSLVWTAGNSVRVANTGGDGYQPIAASAFNVNSDEANKTDLTTVDPTTALTALSKLKVYDYTRIDNGRHQRGVLAQDVAQVIPVAVDTDPTGDLSFELGAMVTTHTAALQALIARLATVEAKTAHLPIPPKVK